MRRLAGSNSVQACSIPELKSIEMKHKTSCLSGQAGEHQKIAKLTQPCRQKQGNLRLSSMNPLWDPAAWSLEEPRRSLRV